MGDPNYNEKAHITQGYISGLLNEMGEAGMVKSNA